MPTNEDNISESTKKIIASKYAPRGFANYTSKAMQDNFADIDERLKEIEHKVNPTAKKIKSNRSQQMLLLHHLGVLDLLHQFKISNKKQAILLSILLNASSDNIEADLSIIQNPKSKLNTSDNYKIVNEAFKQSGIKTLAAKTETILHQLEIEENK